jgi:ABC-type transport system involved in cytochrome c biogenesis ATPase subunit
VSELAPPAVAFDLLERDDERATLAGLLATAAAGESALVVIEGAAGIGKTRLLADLRARASEQAALTLARSRGRVRARLRLRSGTQPVRAGACPP